MRVLLLSAICLMSIVCFSQKDTVITDSTPILSIKQADYIIYLIKEKVKEKITVKEFDDFMQAVNQIVNEAAANYQRKKKLQR